MKSCQLPIIINYKQIFFFKKKNGVSMHGNYTIERNANKNKIKGNNYSKKIKGSFVNYLITCKFVTEHQWEEEKKPYLNKTRSIRRTLINILRNPPVLSFMVNQS